MRVAIVTGGRFGPASICLPALAEQPGVQVALVILCENRPPSRWKRLMRDFRKIRKIGLRGALAGLRMRKWYAGPESEDLEVLAKRHGIRFEMTPRVNAERTKELLRDASLDLALSLGNGYIKPDVFSIPRYGMVNVHSEVLPRFQGAASVIWPIYEGVAETGFTIHQIDAQIDTGPILYQESWPIRFGETLRDTVKINWAESWRRTPPALARVVADYLRFREQSRPQGPGGRYTTPTWAQYRRMLEQHERLRHLSESGAG
jgi:methionyl-tRNA formyltransferase